MMSRKLHTIALIVAAGNSERFSGVLPKPYSEIGGEVVLRRVINTFMSHPRIDGVRVVIAREHHGLYKQAASGLTLFPCVVGGKTRQDSVRRGLVSVADYQPQYILIHDAARALVSHAVIDRVIDGLGEAPAVLPALAVHDTLKKKSVSTIETISRDGLFAAQTPQGFHFNAILEAHTRFKMEQVTDDIALAEKAGLAVKLVPGERANIKLTTQDDALFMNNLAQSDTMEVRVGMGFDTHALIEHDGTRPQNRQHVTICGYKIPYPQKLHGNSDADIGLHALVDAILGAIGEGDIGMHFPPDDPQWAGADSSRFLIHAYKLLKDRGGDIINLDVTIIGESPKISPHRIAMKKRIADILKIDASRVNIKGSTTEKLGFLGRGEGLAAQAVVSVKLPVSKLND